MAYVIIEEVGRNQGIISEPERQQIIDEIVFFSAIQSQQQTPNAQQLTTDIQWAVDEIVEPDRFAFARSTLFALPTLPIYNGETDVYYLNIHSETGWGGFRNEVLIRRIDHDEGTEESLETGNKLAPKDQDEQLIKQIDEKEGEKWLDEFLPFPKAPEVPFTPPPPQSPSRIEQSGQNGGQTGGQSTTNGFGTGYSNGKREVKFFAQQQPLQSDSEGEDLFVSSPDEVSRSNSWNEEEAVEDEDQFQRHNESSLLTDADNYEEDFPMDEEIDRDRDRLVARLSSQHDSKAARPAVLRHFRRAAALAMRNEGGGCNGGTNSPPSEDDELSDDANETKQQRSTWKLAFSQSAGEYVKFRETLDKHKVVRAIKVGNIAFEKHTADGWRTFTDKPDLYQSSPSKTFDTFRFDVEVPENEDARLESCVCFKAGSTEN